MANVIGISSTRVSDLFVRQRVLAQVQYDLREMFDLENQLSSGHQFQLPSENPVAASRVISLQSLLERKEQVKTNLATTQSYLGATDVALSRISGLVTEIRGVALSAVGTLLTDEQRAAAVDQIEEAVRQLIFAGNQQFRDRYLFAGSTASTKPFEALDNNIVEYFGNEGLLRSYSDLNVLSTSNLNGSTAFGAISEPVRGSVDLNPVLTYNTRLADLRGGEGITSGSLAISDGSRTSIVDISAAETIGDVAALIRANPPDTRTVDVDITATGLIVQLDAAPGNLSIREVSGGTAAFELGILRETGVGNNPIVGDDLDPVLRKTTRLADVFGARAAAVVRSTGADNDLIFEADVRGATDAGGNLLNSATISFVDDATMGSEWVAYTPSTIPAVPPTIVVHIEAGSTQARHVVTAVNAAHAAGGLPFTARLDSLDEQNGGQGLIAATATGQTSGGSGSEFDQDSGLQILNGDDTHTISFSSASTIEDVLNGLNGAGAGLLAEINETGTGINVRSRLSGADFAIGENGGTTATQLGLRTFTAATRLEDLNHGGLLQAGDRVGGVTFHDGVDFTIQLSDGTVVDIDLTTEETIGDVLTLINATGGGTLQAQLSRYGNGIELIDESSGVQSLVVTQSLPRGAATDLGLIPSDPPTPGALAAAVWDDGSSPNNELLITATTESWDYNGVVLNIHDDGASVGNVPVLSYDAVNNVLDIEIENGLTTANDVITELGNTPAVAALFTITNDGASTGVGTLTDADPAWQSVNLSGGQPEILTGVDVHPLETEGLFTALLRLQQGFQENDEATVKRAFDLLDTHVLEANFARAELGVRQQGLDFVSQRLESEEVDLRQVLSLQYDADFVEVVSNLAGRQAALEAGLRTSAEILRTSLLDYL